MSARALPITALAFEMVREERSGQLTMVGSISSSIATDGFPTMVGLDIVVVARLDGLGLTELEFAYSIPGISDKPGFEIGIRIAEPDDAALIKAPPFLAPVQCAGDIVLHWRTKGESAWQPLKSWHIEKFVTPETDPVTRRAAADE